MLNPTLRSRFRAEPSFHIPCPMVGNNLYGIPVMPVSACVFVYIMVRNGVFQALIWAISCAETVHFV